jgi:hypothetical protein
MASLWKIRSVGRAVMAYTFTDGDGYGEIYDF